MKMICRCRSCFRQCFGLLLPLVFSTQVAVAAAYRDAIGDMVFAAHDLVECRTEVAAGTLQVTVRYAEGLGLLEENWGVIFIDADLNPDTPAALDKTGADCIVHYHFNQEFGNGFVVLGDQVFDLGQHGTALQAGHDFLTVSLPLSLWGGQSAVRLFVTSNRLPGLAGYDRVPNLGFWDLASDLAVIPRPGNPQVRAAWTDPAGDSAFPDLTRLDTVVSNGYFMIWLTFAHSMENADLHTDSISFTVTLKMDLDHRLWSGFTHANDEPRTLGVDAELQVGVSPGASSAVLTLKRLEPQASIQGLDPELESVVLGVPDTDSHLIHGRDGQFGVASNQLFLSFPLACLRYDDGEMLMTVFASLKATPVGNSDALPDAGAFDTSVGLPLNARLRPAAGCSGPVIVVPDDPNDSLGETDEGEELVGTRACVLDDGGLSITAELEFLEHVSFGFVHLYVDSDHSALTGLPVDTADGGSLGADLHLQLGQAYATFPWAGNPVVAILMDARNPPASAAVSEIGRLVTTRWGGTVGGDQAGGNYSVNFPPELLQSIPGANIRYVLRCFANQNPGIPLPEKTLDRLPESGVVAIPAPAPLPLRILGLTPHQGPPTGGTRVTLCGHGLPPNATVRFGDAVVPNADVNWRSAGELTVITPAHAAGAVPVTVEVPGGGSFIRPDGFQYLTPEVVSPTMMEISPSLGPIPGGNQIQITGLNFLPGAGVTIGGTVATEVIVQSPFALTAAVPPGLIGPADVAVTNPDGKRCLWSGGYNYGSRPPVIWTVFPDYGPLGGGTAVTIVGERFASGATASIGGVPLTGMMVVSDRMITGTTGPGANAGLCEVRVVNPDTVQGRLDKGFTYGGSNPGRPAPFFLPVSVIPLSSPLAGGIEVTIIGHDFQPGVAVLFDGYPARVHYTDSLGVSIEVTAPPHAPGAVELRVVNPDGQSCVLAPGDPMFSFMYETDEPAISLGGVNPLAGPTEGGQEVDIWGERFRPGVQVEFGDIPAQVIGLTNYLMTVITPPHPPGPVIVRVTNPTGLSCAYEGDWVFSPYTFTGAAPAAPVVQQVDPPQGAQGGGETVTVRGQNFFAGLRVFFGARECTNVVRNSSQELTLTTPPAMLGTVDVRVRNADEQTGMLPGGFAYVPPLPVITGLSTNAGPTAGGTSVTLSGSGFVPESQVFVGGNRALNPTCLTASNLRFTTPPGFPGVAAVNVVNPQNRMGSLPNAFTYQGAHAPAPDLDAIFPNAADPAGGTAVVIHGRNFLVGVSVTLGGQPLGQLQIQSPTTLTGVAPAGSPGRCDVVVANTDGQSVTWPDGFIYVSPNAPPTLRLVRQPGDQLNLRVEGEGATPLTLQHSTNLTAWTAVGAVAANTWLPLDAVYPSWTSNSPTFFRAVRLAQSNVPPAIASHPLSQTVALGTNVTFSVTASGTAPLSYQWRRNDAGLANGGNIAGATSSTLTLSTVQPADAGTYQVVVTNVAGSITSAPATLTVVVPLTLATALDGGGLVWSTGGNAPWVAQTDLTHDGEDAAVNGVITDAELSWIETTVTGPGVLTFWWKVSSELDYDFVQFLYDSYVQEEWSGDENWRSSGWTIPAGTHVLRWQYLKDDSVSDYADRAWLDQVHYVPSP